MAQSYDAVVIGAGLGGLSAATLLARRGHSVLLLERHNVPGGYATSFVRGRFEFEVSLHVLSDMGTPDNPGSLRRYLNYLGVAEKVEVVDTPNLCRAVFPDLDVVLPMRQDAFEEAICQAFPQEAKGVHAFLDLVVAASGEIDWLGELNWLPPRKLAMRLATAPFNVKVLPRLFFAKWGDVMARYVTDPGAQALLNQTWGYYGLPPSQVSFLYFALALGTFLRNGGSYPRGRSQALSNAFAQRFQELGGTLRLSCGAKKIRIRGGRVTGVLTDQGDEIEAKVVVSNADPITTSRELIGLDQMPSRYLRRLRASRVGPSIIQVYMGVARDAAGLGLTDHEIMINEDFDVEAHYRKSQRLEKPGYLLIGCPNVLMPEMSPPGTAALSLSALSYGAPWYEVAPEDYVDTKNRIADEMIDMAETVVPGLREHIEVVEVGTPLTMMRYAGHVGGAVYGFENQAWDHTVLRPGNKGPLGGLYFAGAWTSPGGGYAPAMFSGQIAGELARVQLRTGGAS